MLVLTRKLQQQIKIGDQITVTLPDLTTLDLGVYVPNTSDQCFQNSDPEGTELRVYCRTREN